jgi:hypothetical protein
MFVGHVFVSNGERRFDALLVNDGARSQRAHG